MGKKNSSYRMDFEERVNAVNLFKTFGNCSEVSRIVGCSRQTMHAILNRYRSGGVKALKDSPPHNKISYKIKDKVVKETIKFPEYSAREIVDILNKKGICVSLSLVYSIWSRRRFGYDK